MSLASSLLNIIYYQNWYQSKSDYMDRALGSDFNWNIFPPFYYGLIGRAGSKSQQKLVTLFMDDPYVKLSWLPYFCCYFCRQIWPQKWHNSDIVDKETHFTFPGNCRCFMTFSASFLIFLSASGKNIPPIRNQSLSKKITKKLMVTYWYQYICQ